MCIGLYLYFTGAAAASLTRAAIRSDDGAHLARESISTTGRLFLYHDISSTIYILVLFAFFLPLLEQGPHSDEMPLVLYTYWANGRAAEEELFG